MFLISSFSVRQVFAHDGVDETSARVTVIMANVADEQPVIDLGEDGVSFYDSGVANSQGFPGFLAS